MGEYMNAQATHGYIKATNKKMIHKTFELFIPLQLKHVN